jgi:hypothetical protein
MGPDEIRFVSSGFVLSWLQICLSSCSILLSR